MERFVRVLLQKFLSCSIVSEIRIRDLFNVGVNGGTG